MRDWFKGLPPAQRKLTVLFLSICLATLPFYALSFARLTTVASAGLGAQPTSPDPGQLASEELPSSPPTPTGTAAPTTTAVPTEATPSPEPPSPEPPSPEPRNTANVDQLAAELRALVAGSVRAAWSGHGHRDFLVEIDEVTEKLSKNKTNELKNAREQLQRLADRAEDRARKGDLDRRLANQIIAQLHGLTSRL
ncbi:MAG: hypothetical protein GEU73_03575 [Chloroflexi bacterium]|nr:hypothetical protein [Chloroflexota bacterium]